MNIAKLIFLMNQARLNYGYMPVQELHLEEIFLKNQAILR
ncbi:hypothetical protein NB713_000566 [Xanthomonas sacchari]|nr:hypothetical protein [Xanthomonas sacchari]